MQELKTVLRSLGHNPSHEELEVFTTLVDEDRSGSIDFREFLILISQ
jgi:Ca2+-binding EF-hand superfamily protein